MGVPLLMALACIIEEGEDFRPDMEVTIEGGVVFLAPIGGVGDILLWCNK